MFLTTADIRHQLKFLHSIGQFVIDKSGCKLVEIEFASFIADQPFLIREPNEKYIKAEIAWYDSQSLNVNDIEAHYAEVPKIWKAVASPDGLINSNYGWCLYSDENWHQYESVKAQLKSDPTTRRAVAIYTRPSMQYEYRQNGMNDFICTNAVQYMIRHGVLNAYVQMRSNDAVFGYNNDYAWQKCVLDRLANDLNINPGAIFWNVVSLHVYERHFNLL